MKTDSGTSGPNLKTKLWKASLAVLIASSFYGFDTVAQGNRGNNRGNNQNERNQGQGGYSRQSTRRDQTARQQFPAGERNRSEAYSRGSNRNNADRGRQNPGPNFDRRVERQPSPVYSNRDRTIARNDNNNRGFNRPGYNNNSRGFGNNNRPGYNNNRPGGYYNRPNNYNNGNRGYNRYGNNRRPVYNAYNPNWRYAYAPRRNSVFNTLPSTYININFGGFGYRYYDGIYYRPYNNIFRVVAPPIGIYINVLPVGYRRIYVRDYPYYYYNGTYYDYRDNNYTVVSPPVGAVVESIPDGYETLTLNGETYYVVDGAQYKPVEQENGEIWYEVIKSN